MAAKTGTHAATRIILGEALETIKRLEQEQQEHVQMLRLKGESELAVPARFITRDGLICLQSLVSLGAKDKPPLINLPLATGVEIWTYAPGDLDRKKYRTYVRTDTSPFGIETYEEVNT